MKLHKNEILHVRRNGTSRSHIPSKKLFFLRSQIGVTNQKIYMVCFALLILSKDLIYTVK